MKAIRTTTGALAALLVAVPNAFAGETVEVYCSPLLVLTFVGFLALVVVVQLIPAIMAIIGAIKALTSKGKESTMVKAGN